MNSTRKTNEKYVYGILALILAVFMSSYLPLLDHLYITGDAATQAKMSRDVLENGLSALDSKYPPLYQMLGALLMHYAGESGFKMLIAAGLLAIGIASFLLARELSDSDWVGLMTSAIVLSAPRTVFYAARMYMEIFLSGFVLLTLYFFVRYLKQGDSKHLIYSAVSCAITILVKQQGLILISTLAFVLLADSAFSIAQDVRGKKKPNPVKFRNLAVFTVIALAISLPGLYLQAQSGGGILPDMEYTAAVNAFFTRLAGYNPPAQTETAFSIKWSKRLAQVYASHVSQGRERAESRHIWPTDMLAPDTFLYLNSPIWYKWWDMTFEESMVSLMLVLFSAGLILWFKQHIKDNLGLLLLVFLFFNYAAFIRNTDQLRYHVYISYTLAFMIPYAVKWMWARLPRNQAGDFAVGVMILLFVTFIFISFTAQVNRVWRYNSAPSYTYTPGGVNVLIEVADWIRNSTKPDDVLYMVPPNDMEYYSHRNVVSRGDVYFLPQNELSEFFTDAGIKYIIIQGTTVVNDSKWDSAGSLPKTYAENIAASFPRVYTSSYLAIRVYEVVNESALSQ